jgi:phosphatidylserine/phosphatidylglycerophosphate/cardiolipin synthase-like enzyme
MKHIRSAAILLICCFLTGCNTDAPNGLPSSLPPIELYFSPHGGCTEAVVREIEAAKQTILVQAYSFTSAPIAKALVEAHRRGVQVEVILDDSQESEKYSSADFLLHEGVPTKIDAKHAIAHNKVMILDGCVVITGSFNFTAAAEKSNAENLLVIRDAGVAARYAANYRDHETHSEVYAGRQEKTEPSRSSHPSKEHGDLLR